MQSFKCIKKKKNKFKLMPINNQTIHILGKPVDKTKDEEASFEVNIQDKTCPSEFRFALKNNVWAKKD